MDAVERAGFLIHSKKRSYQFKVDYAKKVIETTGFSPAFIAVSFGKDSVVLWDIVEKVRPGLPVVHIASTHRDLLDNYAQIEAKCLQRYSGEYIKIEAAMGEGSIRKLTDNCQIAQENKLRFLGLRIEEQGGREFSLKKYGPLYQYQAGHYRACPLINWTWQDIWAYTVANNLPYLNFYDSPVAGPKSHSRTSAAYGRKPEGEKLLNGSYAGRIAKLKKYSPAFYQFLAEEAPSWASLV